MTEAAQGARLAGQDSAWTFPYCRTIGHGHATTLHHSAPREV